MNKNLSKKSKLSYMIVAVLFFIMGSFVFGVFIKATSHNNQFDTFKSNMINNSNNSSSKFSNLNIPERISGQQSMADVVESAAPGVVTVKVSSILGDAFRGNQKIITGIGTGFFITPTRLLTNQHVVLNEKVVKLILHDGREIDANVLNTDPINDIALLEVSTPGFESSTVLKLGSSDNVRVGEWVVAIGSPLDLSFSGSATAGIISGMSRSVETSTGVSTFIQTDAAINPGNSGGPLFNLEGEVIGINTAKLVQDGVEGIGFAIPIDLAKVKLEELSRPVLNLGIAGVDIQSNMGLRTGRGIYVVEVESGSVAYYSGLLPGDIIINFNGSLVTGIDQLNEIKKTISPGQTVPVIVNRYGRELGFNVQF